MSTTLYIETNFLVGVAFGQEDGAHRLFSQSSSEVQVVLPNVCVMEAMSVVEKEQKERRKFSNEILNSQIRELRRDLTSTTSATIVANLDAARVANIILANEISNRLTDVLLLLSGQPPAAQTAQLIPLSVAGLVNTSLSPEVPDQPTDSLILRVITEHALAHPETRKAFLSGNSNDFGAEPIRSHLKDIGITYFRSLNAFLQWNVAQVSAS